MSRNKLLILSVSLMSVFGGVLLFLPSHQYSSMTTQLRSHTHKPRIPQSIAANSQTNYKKLAKMRALTQKKTFQKIKGYLNAEIELVNDYVPNQPFSLKAKVSSFKEIAAVEYKWVTGEGIEVSSNSKGSAIYNLKPGSPEEIQITLTKQDDGLPARVFLQLWYYEGDKKFAASAFYSSQHQSQANVDNQKLLDPNRPKIPNGLKIVY